MIFINCEKNVAYRDLLFKAKDITEELKAGTEIFDLRSYQINYFSVYDNVSFETVNYNNQLCILFQYSTEFKDNYPLLLESALLSLSLFYKLPVIAHEFD